MWSLNSIEQIEIDGRQVIKATLGLTYSEETIKFWPYKFNLSYTVTLSVDSLNCSLHINNLELEEAFFCQALLHTYLSIPNSSIENVKVDGFQSRPYIDKLIPPPGFCDGEELPNGNLITQEIDRIYITQFNIPDVITLSIKNDSQFDNIISVTANSFITSPDSTEKREIDTDIVFWNPWINKVIIDY